MPVLCLPCGVPGVACRVVLLLQEKIRDVYERAVANVPPVAEKTYWRRYIYLWISYALFEELDARDVDRTRQVYR